SSLQNPQAEISVLVIATAPAHGEGVFDQNAGIDSGIEQKGLVYAAGKGRVRQEIIVHAGEADILIAQYEVFCRLESGSIIDAKALILIKAAERSNVIVEYPMAGMALADRVFPDPIPGWD